MIIIQIIIGFTIGYLGASFIDYKMKERRKIREENKNKKSFEEQEAEMYFGTPLTISRAFDKLYKLLTKTIDEFKTFEKKTMYKERETNKFLDNVVMCEDCGMILNEKHAHKIILEKVGGENLTNNVEIKYYCKKHKKPYDKEVYLHSTIKYFKTVKGDWYNVLKEVDSKGKLIKKYV